MSNLQVVLRSSQRQVIYHAAHQKVEVVTTLHLPSKCSLCGQQLHQRTIHNNYFRLLEETLPQTSVPSAGIHHHDFKGLMIKVSIKVTMTHSLSVNNQ
jgi:hypothetical protein